MVIDILEPPVLEVVATGVVLVIALTCGTCIIWCWFVPLPQPAELDQVEPDAQEDQDFADADLEPGELIAGAWIEDGDGIWSLFDLLG